MFKTFTYETVFEAERWAEVTGQQLLEMADNYRQEIPTNHYLDYTGGPVSPPSIRFEADHHGSVTLFIQCAEVVPEPPELGLRKHRRKR